MVLLSESILLDALSLLERTYVLLDVRTLRF